MMKQWSFHTAVRVDEQASAPNSPLNSSASSCGTLREAQCSTNASEEPARLKQAMVFQI